MNDLSEEAKIFISEMIEANPIKRLSAQEALKSDWFNIVNEPEKLNVYLNI